ncbi:MAG TPA: hypothetical protein VM802_01990 [Chitinophaga sp.]|uniref:hypothetical protein n=1 Tax=Chitinophaga sp. TaxID=1869181 RepID=UPI002C1325A3|nr:hypothetical protein [Chitinophaga sp.]HVI43604.1 hypothetical protein [Chitinophaga sp.]
MNRYTIKDAYIKTISWLGDRIVDWASAGTAYSLDGNTEQLNTYHFGFNFDAAITSPDGAYAFIYKRLGTKGLLLKNGEIVREINRSYYMADVYEYPAAFAIINNRTYLIHCPEKYRQLDFEDAETGEVITRSNSREPHDIFHSRLEVSSDNKYLLSKGWAWHPWDIVRLFDINACITNPVLLDDGHSISGNYTELNSASFIDNERILLGASSEESLDDDVASPVPPSHIAIWNISNGTVSDAVAPQEVPGNFIAIDQHYCWNLYQYPKIVDIRSGEVVDKMEEIKTGLQTSAIIHHVKEADLPLIAYNRALKKLAVHNNDRIEVLWM